MHKTLIIGGNGYIGSALHKRVESDSVDLCAFGPDLGYSLKQNFDTFDISEYEKIVLLAGHSSVNMSEYSRDNAWKNNVLYFYNLCNRLRKDQILIYASSGSVYGEVSNSYASEEDVKISPINQYDMTKIAIDLIANSQIRLGRKIVGLRFGTVNGASLNTRADLLMNAMYRSATIDKVVRVFNGNMYRPVLGMTDATMAISKILEAKEIIPGQFNLCSFNTTINAVAKSMSDYFGVPVCNLPDCPSFNFTMSSDKFIRCYDYKFTSTIQSVCKELVDGQPFELWGRRDNDTLLSDAL